MKIRDDRQFPVCMYHQLNRGLALFLILFGISLVSAQSCRAEISFQWNTSLGASGIETDVINFSNEKLVCNGSYRLLVVDNDDYIKRDLTYEFASYIINGLKLYNFLTKFSDIGLPSHQEVKGIVVDRAMKCELMGGWPMPRNRSRQENWNRYKGIPHEIERRAIESALRNNHISYAIDIFNASENKRSIKVIDLSNSFFNGRQSDMAAFSSLNHIETDRSAIDLYNNGLPSDGDLRNNNLIKSIHKCGFLYFERRTEKCGIENYEEAASEHCGVLEYNSQASTAYCGCARRSGNAMACIGGCPCVQGNVCQHPQFGVKSYKTCRSPKHMVIHNLCRHIAHGIQDAKICPKQ
ncbi:MAG: hypothetical protein IPL83_12460 [Bdellovibrionales bacterium]|nr:hypothetical protein [Bdellovibrionales bacterium]